MNANSNMKASSKTEQSPEKGVFLNTTITVGVGKDTKGGGAGIGWTSRKNSVYKGSGQCWGLT